MINYSTLISMVRPFFFSRGGDELANIERLFFYANCSIQDIYNMDAATFTFTNEKIQGVLQSDGKMKYVTQFPIHKIDQLVATFTQWRSTITLTPILGIPKQNDDTWCRFETGKKEIITDAHYDEIEVCYTKEYLWVNSTQGSETIQLPDRYIPAVVKLMYDWASPVNLMASETQQVDFYSHAMTRVKQLTDGDSLTDAYGLKPAY